MFKSFFFTVALLNVEPYSILFALSFRMRFLDILFLLFP